MQNLSEFLLNQDFPDEHIISYYNNDALTLGDYRRAVSEIESILKSNRIPANTSALLIFEDTPLTLAAFLACIKYGIAPVLTTTFTLNSVVDRVIDAADISIIISDGSRDFTSFLSRVTIVELTGDDNLKNIRLDVLNDPLAHAYIHFDTEKLGFFLMTSGSTGLPKIVMMSHEGMIFTIDVYTKQTLHITSEDRIYSISKTSFGYGLANSLFFPFGTGASIYLDREQFDAESFFQNMDHMQPTVLFGIPTAYQMLINYMAEHPNAVKKLNCIKNYISAGEPLRGDIVRKWKDLTGHFIKDNMGSSEASAILINEGNENKIGSAGKPIPGSIIRLVGADGKDSNTGSLYFMSKSNSIGYYKNDTENALHFKDGYLTTGDVFTIDEDGYFWFVGREDNMMKYHGFWVFPQTIEKAILRFRGVKQVVITRANIEGIDILAAALVVDDSFKGIEALKRKLVCTLEIYQQPKKYIIFDEFPLNERGKTDLKKIKDIIEQNT